MYATNNNGLESALKVVPLTRAEREGQCGGDLTAASCLCALPVSAFEQVAHPPTQVRRRVPLPAPPDPRMRRQLLRRRPRCRVLVQPDRAVRSQPRPHHCRLPAIESNRVLTTRRKSS